MLTHYDVLGVCYDADGDAIAATYQARRRALHLARDGAHRRERRQLDGELASVETAYRTLSDPSERDQYDALLAERTLGEASTPSASAMSLTEFYDDPERAASGEVDFGSNWQRDGAGPWKVVWLEATGELVAIDETGRTGDIGLPGTDSANTIADFAVGVAIEAALDPLVRHVGAAHRAKRPRDEVLVLAIEPDGDRLRRAVTGWQDHMAEPDGLLWLAQHA